MSKNRLNNSKIGRPTLKTEELAFKKKFQKHKTRYELESQFLLLVYNYFHFSQIQDRGQSSRLTDQQLQEVFNYYNRKQLYQLLKDNNKLYYQDKVELEEKQKEYQRGQNQTKFSEIWEFRYFFTYVLLFTVCLSLFSNENLLNDRFLCYFSPKMQGDKILDMMFQGPSFYADDLCLIIVCLLLTIMEKQNIVLERNKPTPLPQNNVRPPFMMNHMNSMRMNPYQYGNMPMPYHPMPSYGPQMGVPPMMNMRMNPQMSQIPPYPPMPMPPMNSLNPYSRMPPPPPHMYNNYPLPPFPMYNNLPYQSQQQQISVSNIKSLQLLNQQDSISQQQDNDSNPQNPKITAPRTHKICKNKQHKKDNKIKSRSSKKDDNSDIDNQ